MDSEAMPADAVAGAAAAVGQYLRVEPDAVLTGCAATALAIAEAFCGAAWIRRGRTATIGAGSGWQRLPFAPVAAIETVTGLPAEGAAFALAAEAYAIDIDGDGVGWVRVIAPGAAGRVRVAYTAGAGGWETVPPPVAQGVVLLATHLFEHREGDAMPPAAVAALWRPYRQLRL
ncbi:head-tail connector protein [Sphingomonas sp. XXL09]|uniref:head-tail connector protein n=1 Tax=Sphingomonas sp. XXL09 TaxID=3457787 RepID=UPI00406BD0DF